MKVYPCGYSIHSAQIRGLMESDPTLLLIDVRRTPNSQMAAWRRPYLIEVYGERYGWFGESLGNINYKSGEPILLANPEPGIAYLAELLYQGKNLLILCGCANYQICHRRSVVDLLRQVVPEITTIYPDQITHPNVRRAISTRQPWAWLITHPEIVKRAGLPAKELENREWTTNYRGELLIHTGSTVDTSLFSRTGLLDRDYWLCKFGSAGQALYTSMPKHKNDYPLRAIIGRAQLTEVVTISRDPWFNGPYGLRLTKATTITPISYPGSMKIFDIPGSALTSAKS